MSRVSPKKLNKIVRFIVNVYAPSWFYIKYHSSCFDGAKNFFHHMKLCHELGPEDWTIVESVLHNNAYFAHPENILLVGIVDSNESVRRFAHEIIKSWACTEGNNICLFDKDNIMLKQDAISYMDMISWESATITTLPLISNISNDQLLQCSFQSLHGKRNAVIRLSSVTPRQWNELSRIHQLQF